MKLKELSFKALEVICYTIVVLFFVWAGRHIFFTSVEEQKELAELPSWLNSFPDWIRYMINDVRKLF